ncbi:hypothetical protein [Pseudosulfitobacter sp. DSM 107133]|uniref:hypothetical protein n=1 Tax=Pseudosulfitobacter sp. DSM 107133 TaxID=2883100 RepID=UPI000DF36B60|nr:hypothetical protein [Pseudosulfitobacter sp. DSM 107133]UOA28664.1 hypothetical protein DSM107133_03414 [Pseudosulfitobacter sp. DSM 107133]
MKNHTSVDPHDEGRSIVATLPSAIFWTASTGLTGYGVFQSIRQSIENDPIAILISLATTSALTFTAFNLFRHAGSQLGKGAKPLRELAGYVDLDAAPRFRKLALVSGLLILLISSWFSFSSMVFLKFGDELQRGMNAEVQASLIAPIRDLRTSALQVERESAALARVAMQRSRIEATDGGQCVASGPGEGPIAQMISDHVISASAIAAQAKAISDGTDLALAAITKSTNQMMVDDAYSKAQNLLASDGRNDILRQAQDLQRGYAGAGFVRGYGTIFCPRGAASMLPALDRLVAAAQVDIDLPASAPRFQKASIVDSATWQLRALLTFGENRLPGVNYWYLFVFGIVALFLDGAGAFTAHLSGLLRGSRLTTREAKALETCSEIMEALIWETPARYHRSTTGDVIHADFDTVLVMPTEVEDSEDEALLRAARRFVSAYGLEADITRTARSLNELPPSFRYLQRRLVRLGFAGEMVDIYRGTSEAWDKVAEHRRTLRMYFGKSAFVARGSATTGKREQNVAVLPLQSV